MEQPDPQVVAAARAGDLAAFGVLVRLYQAPAWRLAFQLLRDEEAASDATQEAFVKAYRYLPAFRGEARFSTWLFSICRNCCLDELRRRRRADRALQRTAPTPDQADHAPGVEVRAALAQVAAEGLERTIAPADYGGCYSARFISLDPEGRLSHHSWGVAIDLNASANSFGTRPNQDPALVEVMEAWGFTWGGRWQIPDGMHFEWRRFP